MTDVPEDLDRPCNLSELGKKAWKIIYEYLSQHGLTYTGGCRAFYSPGEWVERGEAYGKNSLLIVVYDGGDVREPFDSNGDDKHQEAMRSRLKEIGVYSEPCTCWYSAIYAD
jgi:hypothetical protein